MDPSHILIWNVHSLNLTTRQDVFQVLVNSSRIDILCLQDTKMELVTRRLILSMLGSAFDNNFVFLPSARASEGILMTWRSKVGAIWASRMDS